MSLQFARMKGMIEHKGIIFREEEKENGLTESW